MNEESRQQAGRFGRFKNNNVMALGNTQRTQKLKTHATSAPESVASVTHESAESRAPHDIRASMDGKGVRFSLVQTSARPH
ncbi:hypothetical protein CU044_0205 [Streptomyces sp. L-9-10]|nr:hypothetical protein CU044_0205 [Streptomyces sp. L-9-10]